MGVGEEATKVHICAGINKKGAAPTIIFEGIIDATLYIEILRRGLLPFIQDNYPDSHRLIQDNDPKHTSKKAADLFSPENINWWKTPPESPDMNPIENL